MKKYLNIGKISTTSGFLVNFERAENNAAALYKK